MSDEAPDDPEWEVVSQRPFRIELASEVERGRAAAGRRRAVAADLLARLTAARDALDALDAWPLVAFPRGEPPEVPDPAPDERERREAEFGDLRGVLRAVGPQLGVAERLLRRLHGPGPLADPAALAALRALYEGLDDPDVLRALERRPGLLPLLAAAPGPMRAHFGADVTLHVLPPRRDCEDLRVVARGHGLALEEACARELALEEAWARGREGAASRFVSFGADAFGEDPPPAP